MLRRASRLILVLAVLSVSVNGATAEPVLIPDAGSVHAASASMAVKQTPSRNPCNAKRRALIGAVAGSAIAMVVVQQAAKSNDGTAGVKGTVQAAGLGAAVGALVGLRTCP